MNQAVIDIGSNSMRLTLYRLEGTEFEILFREKYMAGLAGYVEDGRLTPEGVACACTGLNGFRRTLEALGIEQAAVFATASLRNVRNTAGAVSEIEKNTGFSVEVISGREEALFGYTGAMTELSLSGGAFVDIGGASTEVVDFADRRPLSEASFNVGSLSLYRSCVKKILPGEGSLRRIEKEITRHLNREVFSFAPRSTLVCVGGTARAVLKLAKKYCGLPGNASHITSAQLEELGGFLCQGGRSAVELILKLEPDRIHTIVPGILILRHICGLFGSEEIIVSKYGVREGYLCQRILAIGQEAPQSATPTPKTGS